MHRPAEPCPRTPLSDARHRLSPTARVAITLAILLFLAIRPATDGLAMLLVAIVLFAVALWTKVPAGWLARRALTLIPVIALLALGGPLSRGFTSGWDRSIGLAARMTASIATALVLLGPMYPHELTQGLRGVGLPAALTTMIGLMLRYQMVLSREAGRMKRAMAARQFTRRPAWRSLASLLGSLFLRAVDRAERVHRAMLARGWKGVA